MFKEESRIKNQERDVPKETSPSLPHVANGSPMHRLIRIPWEVLEIPLPMSHPGYTDAADLGSGGT